MSKYLCILVFNEPIYLTEEQKEHPCDVLTDFFHYYNLSEIRELLWTLLQAFITNNNPPFDDADTRAELLNFLNRGEMLFEAGYLMAKSELQQKKEMPTH